MKLDWNDLKYFLAVAQAKSIAAAAKTLKVNHSTVLRRIDHMEKLLGLSLFIRGKGTCELTEEGNSVFIAAKRMAGHAQELERQLGEAGSQEMAGHVLVSASDFIISRLLAPALPAFARKYPDMEISFIATNDFLNLAQRSADIVIRLTDNPKQHLPPALHGKKIGAVELCAYKGAQSAVKDLKWIAWDAAVDFDRWIKSSRYPPFQRQGAINSALIQLEAVKTGGFAAILPCFMADADPEITRIKGCKPFRGFEAWLLTHPGLKDIKRISVTMQFLADVLKRGLETGNI